MYMDMLSIMSQISDMLEEFLNNAGIWAPIFSTIFVFLEGLLFFLPLFVFVTINIESLNLLLGAPWGTIVGCLLSWMFSVLGCYCTFLLCRHGLQNFFLKHFKKKGLIRKFIDFVGEAKASVIVIFIACAFTPSAFIDIGAGLSNMSKRKYFIILLIGKIFCICFFAYVGTGLIDCLKNPYKLIEMAIMLAIAYFSAKFISKKCDLDEE